MSEVVQHLCPQCGVHFTSEAALVNHYLGTHEGAGPSTPGPRPGLPCHHCGDWQPSRNSLIQHVQRTAACLAAQYTWVRNQVRMDRGEGLPRRRVSNGGSSVHSGRSNEHSIQDVDEDNATGNDEREVGSDGERSGDNEGGIQSGYADDIDSERESQLDEVESDAESNDDIKDLHYDHSPAPSSVPPSSPSNQSNQSNETTVLLEVIDQYGHREYIEQYSIPTVGEPIRRATAAEMGQIEYPDVGKLSDQDAFEIAHVLMRSGISASYRNKYLRMKRVQNLMPWKNSRAMLQDIDKLPHGAGWSVQGIKIKGDRGVEIVELWMRDALEIVRRLLRNKRLGKFMSFKPIKKWTSPEKTEQIRDEINSADWMWEIQAEIQDEHGTIIPIIISSDETRLTNFSGDKKAHPVYLTIGNLPKRLRRRISKRGNILLGYLPVPKLDCETDVEQRRFHRRNLFHTCLRALVEPLAKVCKNGVEVACADGGVRRIYPVLAAYIADFVEQCKVACIKQTHCPLCTVHPGQKGDLGDAPARTHDDVVNAMDRHREQGSASFERMGLYDVKPFWRDYPYVRVDCLLTPDLLHQLHKGVMKDHLTKWVTQILGKQTVDMRHTTMPEYHGMRHFKNGITGVSQWTGRELKEMAKVLLPVMSDANPRVVAAGRALLDFMYLSHSSSLTDSELRAMDESLRTFHANKGVFQTLGAVKTKEAFHGIPKIHMIQHYVGLIKMLGTPDGYNTETSERLHIDFAKMGYRASNRVNAIKQMALYMQRVEALAMHEEHLADINGDGFGDDEDLYDEEWDEWGDEEEAEDELDEENDASVRVQLAIALDEFLGDNQTRVGGRWEEEPPEPGEPDDQGPRRFHPVPEIVLAKTPTEHVTLTHLQDTHNAPRLTHSLQLYLRKHRPNLGAQRIREAVPATTRVDSWSRARLFHAPAPYKPSEGPHIDVIRAQPEKVDRFQRVCRPARFDTVLIRNHNAEDVGIHRYWPARVRVIFELPRRLRHICDQKLAYVELFNAVSQGPVQPTGLHTTHHSTLDGARLTAVVPLSDIAITCHLAPRYSTFQPEYPLALYHDVLELRNSSFFMNIFVNYFIYELFRHWEQAGQPA